MTYPIGPSDAFKQDPGEGVLGGEARVCCVWRFLFFFLLLSSFALLLICCVGTVSVKWDEHARAAWKLYFENTKPEQAKGFASTGIQPNVEKAFDTADHDFVEDPIVAFYHRVAGNREFFFFLLLFFLCSFSNGNVFRNGQERPLLEAFG